MFMAKVLITHFSLNKNQYKISVADFPVPPSTSFLCSEGLTEKNSEPSVGSFTRDTRGKR